MKKYILSAYYPQNNGQAELAIKTVKQILTDSSDTHSQLSHDHTTTHAQDLGISPALMLYGHVIKNSMPSHLGQ